MTSELALQLIHCTGSWGKREVGRILPFSCFSLCQAGLGRACPVTQTPTSGNKTVTTLSPKMKSLEQSLLLVSHSTDDELPSPFSNDFSSSFMPVATSLVQFASNPALSSHPQSPPGAHLHAGSQGLVVDIMVDSPISSCLRGSLSASHG